MGTTPTLMEDIQIQLENTVNLGPEFLHWALPSQDSPKQESELAQIMATDFGVQQQIANPELAWRDYFSWTSLLKTWQSC